MVCVPCIVIPFVLWIFHKYIQPLILKFWNPWEKKGVKSAESSDTGTLDPAMADSEASQYIQKMIHENKVMVFSKPLCPYCLMAKEVLDGVGVVYAVEEIDLRPDCKQMQDVFQQMTGGRTVPRVFINGKCIGGGSETYSLHNQKRLVPLLEEVGASFKKLN